MKNKRKLLGLTATASLLSLSAVLSSCDKVKEYTVTFMNGTETVTTQTVKDGYNASVPSVPTSGDLEFNGWYKDSALTTAFNFGDVITEDTTVYANWVNKYTVTFDSKGGSAVAAKTVREGANVAVPTAPTRTGRVFNGWYADADYKTAFNFGSVITKNTTVYAKWELAEYNVTLYKSATEVFKTVGVKDGQTIETGENPQINYKTFAGWYTDPSLSEDSLWDLENDVATGDMNLYAKFTDETEEVTYKFDYESMIAKFGAGNKSQAIEKFGGFYIDGGAYAEDNKKNYYTGDANDPDVNNQQKAIWFTSVSDGELSFDWRYRSGSSAQVMVYEVDPSMTADEEGNLNMVAPTLATLSSDDEVYNKTSGNGEHATVELKKDKMYVVISNGSVQIQQLQYVNTVLKSAPESIEVGNALSNFLVGDTFASTGLSITLKYANGRTESVKASDVTVDTSAVNMGAEGQYTVTVNYTAEDVYGTYPCSDTYTINVFAVDEVKAFTYSLDSSRNTVHNKLVYAVGDTFDYGKVYLHAYGSIGEGDAKVSFDDQLASSEWELDGTVDMSTVGRKTVTFKYKQDPSRKATIQIEVVEKLFTKDSAFAQVYVDASVEAATKVEGTIPTYKFKSITEALQYLSLCGVSDSTPKVVKIASGTYNEKVFVDMPNVQISAASITSQPADTQVGAGQDAPVITFNAMNGLKAPNGTQYSTDGAATFTISKKATGCSVFGIKIMNYYNTNALYNESLKITKDTQATACLVRGDMTTFGWVTLSGYHDTLYADNGRQYYYNCDIEGRTDYIFGDDATAYFQGCTIRTLGAGLTEKNGGYVVATKGKDGMNYGYIFNECNFVADANTQDGCVSIARGWDKYMKIMVMNCNLGSHFSKGTYGQNYYTKTVTAETFADLVKTGLYTYANEKYTKVTTEEFDSAATYYIQLNDRYTKMNADPVAKLLSEYNNEGNGAIAYTEELATKYADKTFTLLNPQDTKTQTAMAAYEDLNTVFKADNGAVTYTLNWNPKPTEGYASITLEGTTAENCGEYKLSYTNAYVGNTLVDSQISSFKAIIKKALVDGYSLVGLYEDAEFTKEFTSATVLTKQTKIYARIVEGTLTVKEIADYAQAPSEASGWTASATELSSGDYMSATPGSTVGSSATETDLACAGLTKNQYLKSPAIPEEDKVKEIGVVIYGGTNATGEAFQFILTAYDKENNAVATKTVYSSHDKKTGYFSADKDKTPKGGALVTTPEVITLKSTTNDIAYYTVTFTDLKSGGGSAQNKRFSIYSIKTTYEVIEKSEYKNVTTNYKLTFGTYASDTTPAAGTLDGTGNEWLTVNGTDSKWKSGSPSNQFELGKVGNSSYLKFTVAGTGVLELEFKNNSGTNECHIGVSSTDPTASAGATWVKGAVQASSGVATEDTTGYWVTTSGTKSKITYTLEAGTYYIANNFSRAVRITGITLADTVRVPVASVTTSTSNAQLNFNGTATPVYDNTVFDISGLNAQGLAEGYDSAKDYASNKVVGAIKVNVKKGALVYVSAYYTQVEAQVNYTITANGTTTDVLHVNSYVVAQSDQEITITGSGNNYFQDVFVIYPMAEGVTVNHITGDTNTQLEAKAYQYSVYNIEGILIDGVKGKFAPRAQQWAQFNTDSLMLVYLQKGQTFTYTDYEGDDVIKAYKLDGTSVDVTNAGAKQATSYTATEDYTLIVVKSSSNGYIGDFKVTE